jgi:hypothetical protein
MLSISAPSRSPSVDHCFGAQPIVHRVEKRTFANFLAWTFHRCVTRTICS